MSETKKKSLKWEVISHTADYAFRIYGRSIEELVNNSFVALTESLFGSGEEEERSVSETSIKLQAYDPSLLIVDLLRELHYMITSDNVFPIDLKLIKLSERELIAYLNYRLIKKQDSFNVDIKAVTYHNARISQKDDLYFMDVVCDV
jgi:protein archease